MTLLAFYVGRAIVLADLWCDVMRGRLPSALGIDVVGRRALNNPCRTRWELAARPSTSGKFESTPLGVSAPMLRPTA